MKIALLPLDERPANTRYPRMVAAIGGHELRLPPADLLSRYRQPGRCDALAAWLDEQAAACDALLVSCEMLAHGGLIASRISDEPAAAALARLEALRAIRARHPRLTIYGLNVIMRVSRHNNAAEEPSYWAEHGAQMYHLSQLMHRAELGQGVSAELAQARAALPAEIIKDFVARRHRGHLLNRAALQLLADGVFDTLVLSSDDTSPYGLPAREKRLLARRAELLAVGERLLMYPGADEVAAVLVARLLNRAAGRAPSFQPVYLLPGGGDSVAPFEDGPVATTVERQVQAAGGRLTVAGPADVLLFVHPPLAPDAEWVGDYPEDAYPAGQRAELLAGAARLHEALAQRQPAALADVAYANGASHTLLRALAQQGDLLDLAAFGAWNTAGNSIGTVVAQACAALGGDTAANRRFLAHRLAEDWGYQTVVRHDLRAHLRQTTGSSEPAPASLAEIAAWTAARLNAFLAEQQLPCRLGAVTLPWGRTFEVDFDVTCP